MVARYDMRESSPPGTWEVYDKTTGEVARVNGAAQAGLDFEEADDLVDLLNHLDGEIPSKRI